MIVDFSKETDIDLIVMGIVGFRGITGMIKRLGSVSRGGIRRSIVYSNVDKVR
jgi:nucleotide-binding universal stress UspA family protein